MRNKRIVAGIASSALALALFAPAFPASANDGLELNIKASTSAGRDGIKSEVRDDIKIKLEASSTQRIIAKADKEITRRIEALNKLSARIGEMKNVSAAGKASITAQINAEITKLNALKVKIDADTDPAVLKTDVRSITDSYRIYALIMPQYSIFAAADRINVAADKMVALSAKLAVRITEAQTAGKNVTSLQTSLTEMNAKVADAKVQATAAINLITGLTPDGGDKVKAEANRKALVDARAKIKAGMDDLQVARKDAGVITRGLKAFHLEVKATSTVKTDD